MKKIYFLLMAMLVSMVANAWTVKFTNPDNWAEVAVWAWDDNNNYTGGSWPGKLMTKEGDVWTYTGTGNPTKIIFNNNGGGLQTGNLDFVDGATYDKNGPVGAQLNDYTIYFDNSKSNWSEVYVYTFSPDVFGGWPGTKLTAGADGLYAATYKATSEPSFGGVIFNNGVGGTKGVDQTDDLAWQTGATYTVNGLGGDTPEAPAAVWYSANLSGEWEFNFTTTKSESSFTGSFEVTAETGYITFTTGEMTDWVVADGKRYGCGSADVTVESGQAYDMVAGSDKCWNLAKGTWNFTVDFSTATPKVTFTGSGDIPTPVMPDHVYVVGDLKGYSWGTTLEHIVEMTKDATAGTFTVDPIEFEGAFGNTTCYFSFITTPSTTEDDTKWDEVNSGDRFGAPEEGTEVTTGQSYTVTAYKAGVSASAAQSWVVAPGKYKLVFNYNDMTMTLDTSTGIESVAADTNVAAEYYTIMGVRVAEPKAGQIYIVKRGDKVSKMIMK